jgi:hypothetical protein
MDHSWNSRSRAGIARRIAASQLPCHRQGADFQGFAPRRAGRAAGSSRQFVPGMRQELLAPAAPDGGKSRISHGFLSGTPPA